METDKTPSAQRHRTNLPDLHGLAQMCHRVRFATLEQAMTTAAGPREATECVLIHCRLPLEEFNDLRDSPEATFELGLQSFVPDRPCLLMDIATHRFVYRWTLPLWQPMVAHWLNQVHAQAPEIVVSGEGQDSMSLVVTLSQDSRELLMSEHRRTNMVDMLHSMECIMYSGLRAMVDAEVFRQSHKPLSHFLVTSPDVEVVLSDVYRSIAPLVDHARMPPDFASCPGASRAMN